MIGVFRACWTKLRRPTVIVYTYLAVGAVTVLLTALLFVNATDAGSEGGGGGRLTGGATIADLSQTTGMTLGLANAITLLGLVAFCVAAAQVAGEYTQGTLRNLLIRQPSRIRLLAGTWLAVVTFTLGAVLVAGVLSATTAALLASSSGVSTTDWYTASGAADSLNVVFLVGSAAAGYATLGVVLGTVLRAPVPAIALGLAWLLPIETILVSVAEDTDRWLPGQLLSAIAKDGTDTVSLLAAVITTIVYLALAAGGSLAMFVRRDVSA